MTMLVDNNAARVNAYIASAVPEESLVEHDSQLSRVGTYLSASPGFANQDSLLASLRMPENVAQAFQFAQLNQVVRSLRTLEPVSVEFGVSIQTAQFTDGQRGAVLQVGPTSILITESDSSRPQYYLLNENDQVAQQIVGSEVVEGDLFNSPLNISVNDSGNLEIGGFTLPFSFRNTSVTYTAGTGHLSTDTSSPGFGLPTSFTTDTNIWSDAPLLSVGSPDVPPSESEIFDYYSQTPEGLSILEREQAHVNHSASDATRALFVARVRYNRGEGTGVDLFSQYMPDRSRLSGEELESYDAQLELVVESITRSSVVLDDNQAVDPSLVFIMASGVTEAIGGTPDLVARVLRDVDRGWRISMDGSHLDGNGEYYTYQNLFHSPKARITFSLNALLVSYTDAHDRFDVVGHEVAHSLDAYQRAPRLDGVPTYMDQADVQTLVDVRAQLFELYESTGSTSGLDPYAFTNVREFWGEISEYFLSGSSGARVIQEMSPELYGVMSRFYELTYPGI